jgi:hypothetical protein
LNTLNFEQEKEKIRLEKNLERRNIYIEKCILAIIILIVSVCGKLAIEDFKSDQIREQYIAEKKIEAITEIRDACYQMFISSAMYIKHKEADLQKKYKENHLDALKSFMNIRLRHVALLSREFIEALEYHETIHTGVYLSEISLSEYDNFFIDIMEHFDEHCKKETELISDIPKTVFPCELWPKEKLENLGERAPIEFLINQLNKWKQWKEMSVEKPKSREIYLQFPKQIPVSCGP